MSQAPEVEEPPKKNISPLSSHASYHAPLVFFPSSENEKSNGVARYSRRGCNYFNPFFHGLRPPAPKPLPVTRSKSSPKRQRICCDASSPSRSGSSPSWKYSQPHSKISSFSRTMQMLVCLSLIQKKHKTFPQV